MEGNKRIGKKKHARESRSTKTYVEMDDNKKIISFNKKPLYEGHQQSTHLMADDNKKTAWPRITEDGKGGYKEQSYKEALNAGEAYRFMTKNRMIDFARKGNWKDEYKK
jgi:hypothetical protein